MEILARCFDTIGFVQSCPCLLSAVRSQLINKWLLFVVARTSFRWEALKQTGSILLDSD